MTAPSGAATKEFGKSPAKRSTTFSHGGPKQSLEESSRQPSRQGVNLQCQDEGHFTFLHANTFYLKKKAKNKMKAPPRKEMKI